MVSEQVQQLRKALAEAKKKAIQASDTTEDAGQFDLSNDVWEEVEKIQAKLKAVEQEEEASREERERNQVAERRIRETYPVAVIKAEHSEATATQPPQPRFQLSILAAASTPQQLQQKLAAARKELRKVDEEGQPKNVYIEARNNVDAIRSQYKAAVKEEADRKERERKAKINIKVKKTESTEPETKPVTGVKHERAFTAGGVKKENPTVQGAQLPLRQYLHTSEADVAALRLQKAKDAYEDAVTGPAGHPAPKQLVIDLDEDTRRTFLSFNGIRSKGKEWEIWNFETSKWVDWDVEYDPEHARWLLWEYARRLLSVIYFCTHQCRLKDVEQYIPERFYLRLYKAPAWVSELNERRSKLHGQVLTVRVQRSIVPRWKDDYRHPVTPYDVENDTETDKATRLIFFKEQAEKDNVALHAFVDSMGDSIDWQQIVKKETAEDVAAWEWAVKSLAKAANLIYELGNEDDGEQQSGQQQFSRLRNKYWEMFPAGEVAPHHSTISILPHFGRGEAPMRFFKRKREPEGFVGSPVGKMRFDPNGRGVVDLTSDDEK